MSNYLINKGAILTSATVPWHGLIFASKDFLKALPTSFGSGTGCLYHRLAPLLINDNQIQDVPTSSGPGRTVFIVLILPNRPVLPLTDKFDGALTKAGRINGFLLAAVR